MGEVVEVGRRELRGGTGDSYKVSNATRTVAWMWTLFL